MERNSDRERTFPLQPATLAACGDEFADRANLDRADLGWGNFPGDLDGFVHAGGVNEVKAGEAFFRFGERPVADREFAAAHAHALRGAHRFESLRSETAARLA